MQFTTESGSVYEVDTIHKVVRRVGKVWRTGKEWRSYQVISGHPLLWEPLTVGSRVWIYWDSDHHILTTPISKFNP